MHPDCRSNALSLGYAVNAKPFNCHRLWSIVIRGFDQFRLDFSEPELSEIIFALPSPVDSRSDVGRRWARAMELLDDSRTTINRGNSLLQKPSRTWTDERRRILREKFLANIRETTKIVESNGDFESFYKNRSV